MADNNNNNNGQFILDGASLTRPLGFIREKYLYWKDKIEMYIKSNYYKLWLIITNGDIVGSSGLRIIKKVEGLN